MAKSIADVVVGDTVWFHDYQGVGSGKIIAIIEKSMSTEKVACVQCRNEFKSLSIDSRSLWPTVHACTLAVAQRKQQEAAKLLTEAAELFTKAGGMMDEPQQ